MADGALASEPARGLLDGQYDGGARPKADPVTGPRVGRKFRICFVSPANYAVLSGREDLTHIGGAQVQQALLARELAARGHRVSFVTLDHGQPDGVEHDGIRVHKMCALTDGLPGLRFLHPRWTSLCRAMGRADADIYYQRGAGSETGQIVHWCRRNRRISVFACSSDTDCESSLPYLRYGREKVLFRYGLRRADHVVAQTRSQQARLRDAMCVAPTVIRSCGSDTAPPATGVRALPPAGQARALWIGRFASEKRPDLLLDLAAMLPDVRFDIVGAVSSDGSLAADLCARANNLDNVILHGRVPRRALEPFLERATFLVCTSAWEGFPNTFVEAWAWGLPIVSTVDPDGVIGRWALGAVASTAAGLRDGVLRLLNGSESYARSSREARRYYESHHTVAAAVDAYECLFHDLVNRP